MLFLTGRGTSVTIMQRERSQSAAESAISTGDTVAAAAAATGSTRPRCGTQLLPL